MNANDVVCDSLNVVQELISSISRMSGDPMQEDIKSQTMFARTEFGMLRTAILTSVVS